MQSPLKNVIVGDLLQTILIQVQKTKVDVDLAMSALDKLLKSNELNFAFLGTTDKEIQFIILTLNSCRTFHVINLCFLHLVKKPLFRQIQTKASKERNAYERNAKVTKEVVSKNKLMAFF